MLRVRSNSKSAGMISRILRVPAPTGGPDVEVLHEQGTGLCVRAVYSNQFFAQLMVCDRRDIILTRRNGTEGSTTLVSDCGKIRRMLEDFDENGNLVSWQTPQRVNAYRWLTELDRMAEEITPLAHRILAPLRMRSLPAPR